MTKQSSPAGSSRGWRGASERRVRNHSTPSEAKPGSLWTCGPAPSPAATPRVFHQGITKLFSTSRYTLVLTFKPTSKSGLPSGDLSLGLPLHHLQRVIRCVELCPQSLNRPDLQFEGAGNGPVVITWIGRAHELYSGTSPISLIEHCVTFRHDRRLLSLLGFVHNWPTSRWSATKKENWFSLNRNGIMSSFLGQQFYHSTLYIYIYIYIFLLWTPAHGRVSIGQTTRTYISSVHTLNVVKKTCSEHWKIGRDGERV